MTLRIRPRLFPFSGAILLAASSLATAAGVPANLARSDAGARLTLVAPAGSTGDGAVRAAQALLSEADPLGCALGAGTTTILLTLPETGTVNRFDFLNLTAAGRVTVAVSAVALPTESPRWRVAPGAGRAFFTPNEIVTCDLGHLEARHLKITFETQTPGRIDTFGLFGTTMTTGETPTVARPRLIAYGAMEAGERPGSALTGGLSVLRVSSGSGSPDRIVDGSLATSHTFAPTDRRPTTVLDLGTRRSFARVSLAFRSAQPGRLDLYTMNTRAEADAFAPNANRQPTASVRVEGRAGLNRVGVPLQAENVRFLAVVFVPGAGSAEARDYKDTHDYKGSGRDGDGGNSGRSSSRTPNGDGDEERSGSNGRSQSGLSGRGPSGANGQSADGQNTNGADGRSTNGGIAGLSPSGANGASADGTNGGSSYGSGNGSSYGSANGGSSYGDGNGSSGNGSSAGGGNGLSSGNGANGFASGGGAGGQYGAGGSANGSAGGYGAGGSFAGGGLGGSGAGAGAGGGFGLAEVAIGGGPGGGGFGAGSGFGGAGGSGFGSGGDFAFNGGTFGAAPAGSAFNTANGGGGVGGGGSPLNLVPILPPPVGSDLITP